MSTANGRVHPRCHSPRPGRPGPGRPRPAAGAVVVGPARVVGGARPLPVGGAALAAAVAPAAAVAFGRRRPRARLVRAVRVVQAQPVLGSAARRVSVVLARDLNKGMVTTLITYSAVVAH